MVWNSCQYFLSSIAGELILRKIDVFDTWLFCNNFSEKVYISWVFKLGSVLTEIEVVYWVNAGIEEGFENKLTHVLNNISTITELFHV